MTALSSDEIVLNLLQDISKKLTDNKVSMDKIDVSVNKVYKVTLDGVDDGEYFILTGTATITEDNKYPKELVGKYISGYTLKNDGLVDILVGHNSDMSRRYNTVTPGAKVSFAYNSKNIRNIYIKTASGSSAYTLTLQW